MIIVLLEGVRARAGVVPWKKGVGERRKNDLRTGVGNRTLLRSDQLNRAAIAPLKFRYIPLHSVKF